MHTILRYPTEFSFTSACRLATGRSCIMHMANRWQPDHVFMPCFVPEGVINPFIALGVKVVFYKLTETLDVDKRDLKEKMEAHESKRPLVVGLHYFGLDGLADGVADIAHHFGGVMLADCAHAMMGGATTDADAVLYSLNKFLPVVDGALIASRNPELDLSLDHSSLPSLPRLIVDSYKLHLRANAAVADARIGSDLTYEIAISDEAYDKYYKFIDERMEPFAQSEESRATEAASDLPMMLATRYLRGSILTGKLEEQLLVREAQTPQFAYPIRCLGQRERMVSALTDIGVLPSTLQDRWDHIPLEGFDVERRFIDDHLLLPINETVDMETLVRISKVLNGFAWGHRCETISLH